MNISLFIKSLSDSEIKELKKCFFEMERVKNMTRIPIKEFVSKNKISARIANVLLCYVGDNFNFADEICKETFFKFRNVGKKSWLELEKILIENNLPVR